MRVGMLDFSLFETKPSWHDFTTDDWSTEGPVTDEVAKRYISQDKAVQMLYDCHRALGEDIEHALIKTLEACCGVTS